MNVPINSKTINLQAEISRFGWIEHVEDVEQNETKHVEEFLEFNRFNRLPFVKRRLTKTNRIEMVT